MEGNHCIIRCGSQLVWFLLHLTSISFTSPPFTSLPFPSPHFSFSCEVDARCGREGCRGRDGRIVSSRFSKYIVFCSPWKVECSFDRKVRSVYVFSVIIRSRKTCTFIYS